MSVGSKCGRTSTVVPTMASAAKPQDISGKRVRSSSGALVAAATRKAAPGLRGVWFWRLCVSRMLVAVRKQMKAVIASAATTRSSRPRRSQRGRGAGGFVELARNAATALRASLASMALA